jgi:hypothetical protein
MALHAHVGSTLVDSSNFVVDNPTDPLIPPVTLIPNLAGRQPLTGATWTVNYSIAQGSYAGIGQEARSLAGLVNSRIQSRVFIGNDNEASDLQKLQVAVDDCVAQNKALGIYYYFVPNRDGNPSSVASSGAKNFQQYQDRLNACLSIIPSTLPTLWLLEPDALSGGVNFSADIKPLRIQSLSWLYSRLMDNPNPNWCVLAETSNPVWRPNNDVKVAEIVEQTSAWKCDGQAVGMANFIRFSALHTYAKSISSKVAAYRPNGWPYILESYGSSGTSPVKQAQRTVTGLGVTAGDTKVTAPVGTFRSNEVDWYGPRGRPTRGFTIGGNYTQSGSTIKTFISSSEIRMSKPALATGTNLSGVISNDSRDGQYNSLGPVCGPPLDFQPAGGYDGEPLCCGAMHLTNPCVSNDNWNPRGYVQNAPEVGLPWDVRILEHVGGSPYFQ